MRLVTFLDRNGVEQIGALSNGDRTIVSLQAGALARDNVVSPFFRDMLAFLEGGMRAREEGQKVVAFAESRGPLDTIIPLDSVTLLAPVPRPESIRDCLCFEQHIINCIRVAGLRQFAPLDEWIERTFGRKRSIAYRANKAWYERPIYYKGNRFSVVGTNADVIVPQYTRRFDYELEWGIFIGKKGTDISKGEARSHIGGYTIFNDFSARDVQMKEQAGRLGPAKGKDFDAGNAMGPCLVTPDEIADPYNLTMLARINRDQWSRGSTADMHWSFEELIEYISRSETIYPGEFFGSGTCSGSEGCGCGLEMGRYLKAGDVVELEVEKIGILRNRIIGSEASAMRHENFCEHFRPV
jgi:2-keto-4-pentenoate hydratase/2-oxohepta-3-ene-1,7-dioic acid hydratase in catechol pathway